MAATFTESYSHFAVLRNQFETRLSGLTESKDSDVQTTEMKMRLSRLQENLQQLTTGRYQNHLIAPCKTGSPRRRYTPVTVVRNESRDNLYCETYNSCNTSFFSETPVICKSNKFCQVVETDTVEFKKKLVNKKIDRRLKEIQKRRQNIRIINDNLKIEEIQLENKLRNFVNQSSDPSTKNFTTVSDSETVPSTNNSTRFCDPESVPSTNNFTRFCDPETVPSTNNFTRFCGTRTVSYHHGKKYENLHQSCILTEVNDNDDNDDNEDKGDNDDVLQTKFIKGLKYTLC
ncbi:hypothetical protein LOTGIDRAFT_173841 [Lottia gigantea]|uniref:Uncharacterized protein n=1 Tax=Lottia gigantea TaxID=225164 RepID=V4A5E7_LOTGI|nr:hypothetical protein LOTGIDRAFT_173841 [Lottia gigantea]ESO99148.1 hypothetical protein LOTGIDRAFT_173841 [Lottia gigantea]